jgi:hypothetical protein
VRKEIKSISSSACLDGISTLRGVEVRFVDALLLLNDEKLDLDLIHRRTAAIPESTESLLTIPSRPVSASI